jgi:RimJ/RimL family protein N-acetyltransferase
MEYLRAELNGEELVLRDLVESEIEVFVDYWHESPPEYLDFLGVDREKLGTREDTRERFRRSIRSGDPRQERVVLVLTLAGRPIAYANLHFVHPMENYLHAHVVDPDMRDQGIASLLLLRTLQAVFDSFPIERLIIQTRPTNTRINHVLQKAGLTAETRFIPDPDGLPVPGEFCVYDVDPAWVSEMSQLAAAAGA